MEDVLLACLVLLTCACLALASAAVVAVAVVMKDWLRPPQAPRQATSPGETVDDLVNGALGWDDTDPTDHVMPPNMFPQRTVHPSMRYDLIDTPEGDGVDPELTIDQLRDGPDEPTILGDGTIILRGEVIKEGDTWNG
jgi:hypothetical protein